MSESDLIRAEKSLLSYFLSEEKTKLYHKPS